MSTDLAPASQTPVDAALSGVDEWLDGDEFARLEFATSKLVKQGPTNTAIAKPEDYETAVEHFKALGELRKYILAKFAPFADVANAVHKKITAARSALVTQLQDEEKRINALAQEFVRSQEKKRRADEERMRNEAAEREAAEREIAAKMAQEAGAPPEEVEAARNAPSIVPPPVMPREHYVPPTSGTAQRDNWKAEIEDFTAYALAFAGYQALPNGNLMARDFRLPQAAIEGIRKNTAGGWTNTFLNREAKSRKDALKLPGVRVYNDAGLARTGRGA